MIYFIILFILLLFSILDIYLEVKRGYRKGIYFLSILIVTFLVGLRGDVEPDYRSYLDIFNKVSFSNLFSVNSVEIGYNYYNYIVKEFLLLPFQFVVFTVAFITIWLKFKFLKNNSPRYLISFLLYYCSLLFLYDFIAIRQALAMSIFMISIPFIIERRFLKYLLCIFIASLFHISAVILFPLYFIINKKINNYFALFVLIGCLYLNINEITFPIISFFSDLFSISSVSNKLEIYSLETEYSFISIRLLIFSFIFLIFKFFNNKNEKFSLYFNIFLIGIVTSTILNEVPQFSYRIKAYFVWADIILWVLLVENFCKKHFGLKIIIYIILVLVYSITLYDFFEALSERGNYIYPYKFFWDY